MRKRKKKNGRGKMNRKEEEKIERWEKMNGRQRRRRRKNRRNKSRKKKNRMKNTRKSNNIQNEKEKE